MSLVKCHECAKEVSSEAKACPHCGAKVKKPVGLTGKLIVGFFAVSIIGGMIAQETAPKKSAEQIAAENEQASRAMFVRMAIKSLKKAARDPESVIVDVARSNKDGSVICLEYRARNGFGGMNREHLAVADGKALGTPKHWNTHCTKELFDMTWAAK